MKTLTHRYLARLVVEAETPLAVGTGQRDIMTNQMVVTDINGLPYIPGTSLAGVLRHALESTSESESEKDFLDKLFGFQIEPEKAAEIRKNQEREPNEEEKGQGSRLILSHARMIGKEGSPIDVISEIDWKDSFYLPFLDLPVRQHVRISHQGTSEDKGKFDEQVVYKGARFCFELEFVSDGTEAEHWDKMLKIFKSPMFRIGGGTRKGFGELSIKECKTAILNLSETANLDLYLNKTSSLNDKFWKGENIGNEIPKGDIGSNLISYELKLQPDNFFLFSSGLESEDAKMVPVIEKIINWTTENTPEFTEAQILVPASSIKGAIAHRLAFHYNKLRKVTAEFIEQEAENEQISFEEKAKEFTGENNDAVRGLFGFAAKDNDGKRGNVLFSDLFKDKSNTQSKILNHVAIDRFTGGAMEGALFNEEVVYNAGADYTLQVMVLEDAFTPEIKEAFEKTLTDIGTGMLPLGGGTMRGHGTFTGTLTVIEKENKNEN